MVIRLQLEDSIDSVKRRGEDFVVRMILLYGILEWVLLLHELFLFDIVFLIMNF